VRLSLAAALSLLLLGSCAGVRSSTETVSDGGTTTPVPAEPTVVKITTQGASPQVLHIFTRDAATFVNEDDRPHDIRSDPRQNADSRCSTVGVGLLQPGETKLAALQPSGIACFYRDEREPDNPALQGYVLAHY
jgi:hypothetical protein